MGTKYDWAGSRIMSYPIVRGKRTMPNILDDVIVMDVRDFIVAPNRKQISDTFKRFQFDEPPTLAKEPRKFDERARMCWQFMMTTSVTTSDNGVPAPRPHKAIEYVSERRRRDGEQSDIWQFASETIARSAGDCEDLSILLAGLMIGSGISPYCVRVVIGRLFKSNGDRMSDMRTHAWVAYKTEQGPWALIDATWDPPMFKETGWHFADYCDDGIADATHPTLRYHYVPSFVFNNDHAWETYVLESAEKNDGYGSASVDHR